MVGQRMMARPREEGRRKPSRRETAAEKKPIAAIAVGGSTLVYYFPPPIEWVISRDNPNKAKKAVQELLLLQVGINALSAREARKLAEWMGESERTGKWEKDVPGEILAKVTNAISDHTVGQYGNVILEAAKKTILESEYYVLGYVLNSQVNFNL